MKRAGADVDLVNENGKSLLMFLVSEGHEELVGKFLKVALHVVKVEEFVESRMINKFF